MATLTELLDPNQKHETESVKSTRKLRIGIIGTGRHCARAYAFLLKLSGRGGCLRRGYRSRQSASLF